MQVGLDTLVKHEVMYHIGKLDFVSAKRAIVKAINLKPNDVSLRQEYTQLLNKEQKNKQNEEGNLRGNPNNNLLFHRYFMT